MSQSGYIAALLLAAFVLFLAAQNRLVKYAAVLWGDTTKMIPHPSSPFPLAAPAGGAPAPGGGGLLDSLPGVSDFGPALLEAAPLLLAP